MDERRGRWLRNIELGVGTAGLALAGRFAWLYWRQMHGPGDDNPIAFLFLLGLGLALLPAAGLPLALSQRQRGAFDGLFALAAVATLLVVLPLAWILW